MFVALSLRSQHDINCSDEKELPFELQLTYRAEKGNIYLDISENLHFSRRISFKFMQMRGFDVLPLDRVIRMPCKYFARREYKDSFLMTKSVHELRMVFQISATLASTKSYDDANVISTEEGNWRNNGAR